MHSPKIELISAGRGGQPAVVRIGPHDYIAFDHDPNTILVLEETAKDFLLQDLPTGIALTPCKRIQELGDWSGDGNENWTGNGMGEWGEGSEIPITPSRFEGIAPFRIYRADHDHAGLVFSWHCTKDFWNHDAGYRWKLQQARSAVQASRKDLSGLRFHRLIDRGYWAGIEFSLFVPARSLESIMKTGYLISETLHSVIETAVCPPPPGEQTESIFTRQTLIPLLKNLGFRNVTFHHGTREFGRDVLFQRQTEFGLPEYWAAQVKLGNVSGKSNSYLDLIVNQAQEAFKMPLYDIQTKSRIWIAKFVVVISGRFTENAVEKICEKIESHSQKNNILFIDGERIQELMHPPFAPGLRSRRLNAPRTKRERPARRDFGAPATQVDPSTYI